MIYVHTLGRAARYFPERTALAANGTRSTFLELHERVGRIAGALTKHDFKAGDRLALLLPNEPDYIQFVYACAWLGIIAVPLNTRLSVKEIDGILTDAQPRGLIRHSSLPVPTLHVSWQLVLDQEPLDAPSDSIPDPIYDPHAILALIYTSGTTGRPKGVEIRHGAVKGDRKANNERSDQAKPLIGLEQSGFSSVVRAAAANRRLPPVESRIC